MIQDLLIGLILGLVVILAVGCASVVEINDHEWCIIAGSDGAYCFYTISEKERDLTQSEWLVESRGWFAGSPEAYGNLKEALDQLCSETKKCDYEELKKFFSKVSKAQKKAGG